MIHPIENRRIRPFVLFLFISLMFAASHAQTGGQYDKKSDPILNRRDGVHMLKQIKQILIEYYYDPKYRGIDLDAHFKAAEEQIKTLEFKWQIHRVVAQTLIAFNDSHTSFIPADRLYRVEYGFSMMIVGNSCFVSEVKKGSDAEKKGLKPSDQIVEFSGLSPSRGNFGVINHLIYVLDPQETVSLKILTKDNKSSEITLQSRFISPAERNEERKKRLKDEQSKPYKCVELSAETVACKFRTFVVEKEVVDKMMKFAAPYKKLILDLRGNGGGYVETEAYLSGYFFDKPVKIGTEVLRDKKKDRFTKVTNNPYSGELYVLIDSESASAAEMFARIIQIQKRGKIIGDTSMGAVMTSYSLGVRLDVRTATIDVKSYRVFGVNVSIGDMVMSDGNRLEGVGVTPDFPLGPTPLAFFIKSDPVLAFAAQLAGSPITPEKAGEFYFVIPKSEEASDQEIGNSSED